MKITTNTDSYMVIDDFLDEKEFKYIRDIIFYDEDFKWNFVHAVSGMGGFIAEHIYSKMTWRVPQKQTPDGELDCMMVHGLYIDNLPVSDYAKTMMKIFLPKIKERVTLRSLIRIKTNCYMRTHTVEEHSKHMDYDYEHTSGLFSLNTCDGFTRLEDGTKIDSVENRMLFFDGSRLHNSSTTTNARARFNMNFNFI